MYVVMRQVNANKPIIVFTSESETEVRAKSAEYNNASDDENSEFFYVEEIN